MTFLTLDSARPPTPAHVAAAAAQGFRAWLGYGTPSGGWSEADDWTTAPPGDGFAAVLGGGLLTALLHFGPDYTQAIAQAKALGITAVEVDKESNDPRSYVTFGQAVQAAGLLAVEYGTVNGVTADVAGFESYHLAEPGWTGTPGDRYAVQNRQVTISADGVDILCDVSDCGDGFLTLPATSSPTPAPPQPPLLTNVAPGEVWGRPDPGWTGKGEWFLSCPQLYPAGGAVAAGANEVAAYVNSLYPAAAVTPGQIIGWNGDLKFYVLSERLYIGSFAAGVGH